MLRKCQEVSRPDSSGLGLDVDHGRRAKHRPGELLGPRPLKTNRRTGRLCQPGCLDGAFARVLAPEPAAKVRNDHPDAVVCQAKRPRELAAHAERLLARRPDGHLAIRPLGHGRAWLHRAVLDVGDVIGLAKGPGRPEFGCKGTSVCLSRVCRRRRACTADGARLHRAVQRRPEAFSRRSWSVIILLSWTATTPEALGRGQPTRAALARGGEDLPEHPRRLMSEG